MYRTTFLIRNQGAQATMIDLLLLQSLAAKGDRGELAMPLAYVMFASMYVYIYPQSHFEHLTEASIG